MAFRFGFGGDDQALDPSDGDGTTDAPNTTLRPVKEHGLEELLSALPSNLSYSTIPIESPTGRVVRLPRREIHDVRVQLLSEELENDEVIDQLEKSDLRSGVYEGGFKTWECAIDLASLLLDRGPRKDIDELIRCEQVIELGAGSALPSLVLFQHALTNAIPLTFVLTDYNDTVLRLVTLPNILLTWAANTDNESLRLPDLSTSPQGDLGITSDLLEAFRIELQAKSINLIFLSGPWSPALASLTPESGSEAGSLILAAETIYSPASTQAFVEILVTLLKRVKMAKAMIGAKRMYFGVGGSVDQLKEACRERGAVAYEIENHGVTGMEKGVGRALVEVQMY